ncbi:MAG TPA: hypothetical protein VHU22_02950 [Xanthobacteraceae bacterium]|jgi:hypothetical protein|nr:hypothetical protein [Xanthobacteraceae bacterium]
MMKVVVVRYQARDGSGDENERLIKSVFAELEQKSPDGLRYVALRLEDGTFVHVAAVEDPAAENPLRQIEAFRLFQTGIGERCVEPPRAAAAKIVGHYRIFA